MTKFDENFKFCYICEVSTINEKYSNFFKRDKLEVSFDSNNDENEKDKSCEHAISYQKNPPK